MDKSIIHEHHPDAGQDGIFPCNDDLRKFLVSSQAALAGLLIQHGWETTHNAQQARQFIEDYVVNGKDRGITENLMRQACSLPKREQVRSGAKRGLDILDNIHLGMDEEEGADELDDNGKFLLSIRRNCVKNDTNAIGMGRLTAWCRCVLFR